MLLLPTSEFLQQSMREAGARHDFEVEMGRNADQNRRKHAQLHPQAGLVSGFHLRIEAGTSARRALTRWCSPPTNRAPLTRWCSPPTNRADPTKVRCRAQHRGPRPSRTSPGTPLILVGRVRTDEANRADET